MRPFHRAFARLHNSTRIGYPERSATLQVQCAIYSTGRNYRTNKQLIEGIFGGWFYERSCEPKKIEAHHGSRDFASNTHLRGDVRCRALLRGVKSAVAKTLLSMPDLRYRALAEIRKQPGARTFRASRSIASRISTLRIIGRYVYHQQARLMPTRPPVRRYMSKAFCAAIMI
jgi:hypothetical protein